jgi:hypothetical protein
MLLPFHMLQPLLLVRDCWQGWRDDQQSVSMQVHSHANSLIDVGVNATVSMQPPIHQRHVWQL